MDFHNWLIHEARAASKSIEELDEGSIRYLLYKGPIKIPSVPGASVKNNEVGETVLCIGDKELNYLEIIHTYNKLYNEARRNAFCISDYMRYRDYHEIQFYEYPSKFPSVSDVMGDKKADEICLKIHRILVGENRDLVFDLNLN